MKALITGVNGFVGPYLKKHLLENNIEVIGTDISSGNEVDSVSDLLDNERIMKLVENSKPDFIFHLAAQSSVKLSWQKPELTRNVNVNGTRNLLDAVKKFVPESRVLVVSSADIYGVPKEFPIKEGNKLNPVSPYGESRLEQEKLALGYGLNVIISRSFSHTGPGQSPVFVCSDFAKQIAEIEKGKEPVIKVGNLNVKRDFTDVRDIIRAYLMCLKKCDIGEAYNICSGRVYSIREILDILLKFTDKDIKIKEDKGKKRKKDILVMDADNSKFVSKTGWKAEIPFEETLKGLLDYWRGELNI